MKTNSTTISVNGNRCLMAIMPLCRMTAVCSSDAGVTPVCPWFVKAGAWFVSGGIWGCLVWDFGALTRGFAGAEDFA